MLLSFTTAFADEYLGKLHDQLINDEAMSFFMALCFKTISGPNVRFQSNAVRDVDNRIKRAGKTSAYILS